MNSRYYSQFVGHCMRFYVRYPNPKFKRRADKLNWIACDTAVRALSGKDRSMILNIYSDFDTLSDSIYRASKAFDVEQDTLWRLVYRLERDIARNRGLI